MKEYFTLKHSSFSDRQLPEDSEEDTTPSNVRHRSYDNTDTYLLYNKQDIIKAKYGLGMIRQFNGGFTNVHT